MKKLISFFSVLTILTLYVVPFLSVSATTLTESQLNGYIGALALSELVLGGQASSIDIHTDGWGTGDQYFLETLGECIKDRDYDSLGEFGIDLVREALKSTDMNIAESWYWQVFQQGQDLINVDGKECLQLITDSLALVPASMKDILSGYVEEEPYQPPADYTQYIDHIMNNQMWQGLNYSNNLRYAWETYSFLWCTASWGNLLETYSGGYFYGSTDNIGFMPCEPLEIYVNEVNGSWYITHSTVSPMAPDCKIYQNNNPVWGDYGKAQFSNNVWALNALQNISNLYSFNYFWWVKPSYVSLESAFVDLRNFVSHVTIYVNGNKWTDATAGNNQYPLDFGDIMTLYNEYPTMYYYPSPSYIDIDGLYQMILDAINNSDIITYNDIKPFILDINGQEAVATVNIVRTDYDRLIEEQYPIYITKDNAQLQQPLDLLEESKDYIQYIANNAGSDLIPEDILQVISVCGIVILVGYLINRMLE